jgi:hypothetical protein
MRWHKEGERENKEVMVHYLDGDASKALDSFDPEFVKDAANFCIGLTTNGFTPFGDNTTSYSCWLMFYITYNPPPLLHEV